MAREVLVVEDEPDIRRLVVLHLERDGFRCRTATNGSDALREVKASVPDLVVLDLMLPEVDGLEVCRRLRRDTACRCSGERLTSRTKNRRAPPRRPTTASRSDTRMTGGVTWASTGTTISQARTTPPPRRRTDDLMREPPA